MTMISIRVYDTERDALGRLTKLDKRDPATKGEGGWGAHSVCQHPGCGKDMPRVWDTICRTCQRPFCYAHSIAYQGRWYCRLDVPRAL